MKFCLPTSLPKSNFLGFKVLNISSFNFGLRLFHPVSLASNTSIPSSFLKLPPFFHSYDKCAAFNLILLSTVIPHPVAFPLNTHTSILSSHFVSNSGILL